MSASVSVVLPALLRRRSEVIGLVAGSFCFLFAFFGNSLGALLPSGPPAVVLPMVLFSALAGAVATFLANSSPECPVGAAPRLGIRAGLFAAFTGGAFTVWAATLHAFGIGSFPTNASSLTALAQLFPHAGVYLNLILSLLGIPPAIFFGIAGALMTTMVRARFASGQPTTRQTRLFRLRDPIFSGMLAISAIGYLSPFTVALKPKPKPVAIAPVAPIRPLATPTPPPPPPKWRYKKPEDFDSAEADQITVSVQRTFEIDGSLPVALSPEQTRLAYFRRAGNTTLEVRELDTLDVVQSIEVGGNPSALCWSADGTRLLIVNQAASRMLQVCDSSRGTVLLLPQPVNEQIPEGQPNWWSDDEVLFSNGDTLKCLSLDTLRVSSPAECSRWNAIPKEKQTSIVSYSTRPALPANFRWILEPGTRIRSYQIPVDSASPWTTNRWLSLTLADPDNAYRALLSQVEINQGDVVLATTDGSKFVRIRDGFAMVFYLGMRPKSSLTLTISMPAAPNAALTDALAGKSVCAFICAPIINPLNGKTVGPNRGQVRALARIAKWKDDQAEAWITEEYYPVRPGDVIADLHVWNDHRPFAIQESAAKDWFTVIDRLDRKAPPPQTDAPPLDRQISVNVMRTNGSERIDRIIHTSLPHSAVAKSNSVAPANLSSLLADIRSTTNQTPSSGNPTPSTPILQGGAVSPPVAQQLATFIFQHHAKSSHGDIPGLVADYADRVDHFDHGIVDREFIRKDESDYHSPGTQVTETVIKGPTFVPITANLFSASYSLSFLRVRPDRHWTKGISDIEMQISLTPAGPRITSQRSQSHDIQKGR